MVTFTERTDTTTERSSGEGYPNSGPCSNGGSPFHVNPLYD